MLKEPVSDDSNSTGKQAVVFQLILRKYPPQIYTTITTATRKDGFMFSWLMPNSDSIPSKCYDTTHQTRQPFSKLLLSSFGKPVWIVASVSCFRWQERLLCGLRLHLLQGLCSEMLLCILCCRFFCCLAINLKQFGHFPLKSDINKAFLPREVLLTGYFLGPCSVKSRDCCMVK